MREKLRNAARKRNADFGLILAKYGLERMLHRLSHSTYRSAFILKGVLLFELWTNRRYRPTRDADFLASGDNSPDRFAQIFREICAMEAEPDGLRFESDSVVAERIRENADYEGIRVTFTAYLERANIPIQIDVGFGDAITPGPVVENYPTLLESSSPRLLTYPRETVVAETLEAMVRPGIANTRMKDFYDLDVLSQISPFDGNILAEAIQNRFERRGTDLPADDGVHRRNESGNNSAVYPRAVLAKSRKAMEL